MSRFDEIFPILTTRDLPALVDFYRDAADATVSYEYRTEDGTLGYVSLKLAGGQISLGYDPSAPDGPQRASLWLYTDDCDAACDRLVAAGADLLTAPADMPWGERVADVRDPGGNLIHLGQRNGS